MKLKEFIVESEQQVDELTAADVGRGVGKAAGAVGAVAGGVKGAWQAAKKGFEKGRATVAGEAPPAAQGAAPTQGSAPQQQAAPAQQPAAAQGGGDDPATLQQQIKQKELELKDLQGKLRASQKAADTAANAEKAAAQTQQAQQTAKNPADVAPQQAAPQQGTQQAAAPAQEPVAQPTAQKPAAAPAQTPAAPQQQAAPAQEPAAQQPAGGKLTPQQIAAKKAELQNRRAGGTSAGTTASGFKQYTKDASSQRVVGANPDGSPKIQQIKAGKINTGNNLSEALARKIEIQKRKMFETGLATGQTSIFVK